MRDLTRDELELRERAAARLEEKRRAARTDARQPTLIGNFFDAPTPSSSSSSGRARVVYLARKHGRRVRCTHCGAHARARCSGRARLRKQPCPRCGGRLRPLNWEGWNTWTGPNN